MTARKHGGAREGAGRPPINDEPMVRVELRLPRHIAEALRAAPDGVSATLRKIAERWYKQRRK